MSKVEEAMVALQRFGEATASVCLIAHALVMTERADVFDVLCDACAEMRDAQQALESAQKALVVDAFEEALEGAGEGGMAS